MIKRELYVNKIVKIYIIGVWQMQERRLIIDSNLRWKSIIEIWENITLNGIYLMLRWDDTLDKIDKWTQQIEETNICENDIKIYKRKISCNRLKKSIREFVNTDVKKKSARVDILAKTLKKI